MESWLIAQFAEISAINAEIQGMVAENENMKRQMLSPKYTGNDFQEKAQLLWDISKQRRTRDF